jgi:hypothetical protein
MARMTCVLLQVTFSSPGFEDWVENWLRADGLRLRRDFLVLTASREYANDLMGRGIAAYDVTDWMDGHGGKKGLKLTGTSWIDSCKALFSGWAAAHGYNVLASGADVVFLKNPFEHVCNDAGIEIQSDIMLGGQTMAADSDKVTEHVPMQNREHPSARLETSRTTPTCGISRVPQPGWS